MTDFDGKNPHISDDDMDDSEYLTADEIDFYEQFWGRSSTCYIPKYPLVMTFSINNPL